MFPLSPKNLSLLNSGEEYVLYHIGFLFPITALKEIAVNILPKIYVKKKTKLIFSRLAFNQLRFK